jgi:hypothetical protein
MKRFYKKYFEEKSEYIIVSYEMEDEGICFDVKHN